MLNTDFNPYDLLLHLQDIQHQQAENMVKISEWMMDASTSAAEQAQQIQTQARQLAITLKQLEIAEQRIMLLEKHLLSSINNTTSKETIPTWDI